MLFWRHRGQRVAAALSFYAVFTVPPLILAVLAVTRAMLGRARALATVDAELRPLIGGSQHKLGTAPLFFGIALGLVAIFAIFVHLQETLDDVWEVRERRGGGVWGLVRLRLRAAAAIPLLGALAVFALCAAAAGGPVAGTLANALAILLFLTVAYRLLSRAGVAWKTCFAGAAVTGMVLIAGESAISVLFARLHPESGYGTTGSIVALLIWLYYSALLFLVGAILTRALDERARRRSHRRYAGRILPLGSRDTAI